MKQFFQFLRHWQVVALLLAAVRVQGQAPAWQTAVALGPSGSAYTVTATNVDVAGAVYLAGYFSGTITLGSVALTSAGGQDGFVAKWSNASNSFVWAQQAGGSGTEAITALAVSGANVYVGGTFGVGGGTVALGSTSLTNTDATNATYDSFVAKLTDAGVMSTFTWAHRIGSVTTARNQGQPGTSVCNDLVSSLTVSGANVYAAGIFEGGVASVDGAVVYTDNVGAAYNRWYRLMVTQFTDAGSTSALDWFSAGVSPASPITGLSLNTNQFLVALGGNIYVAGAFSGDLYFGNYTASAQLVSGGSSSIYVAKFGPSGGLAWVQQVSQGNSFGVAGLAANNTGLYLAGDFSGTSANFGRFAATPYTLANADPTGASSDYFLAKLIDSGTSGNFAWVKHIANRSPFRALAVSGPNLYLAGSFTGSTGFGSTTLTSVGGSADMVVVKTVDVGSTGTIVWAQQAGGPANDYAAALSVSGSTVYVAGAVGPAASFGSQVVTGAAGTQTAFLASFTDPTLTANTPARGSLSFSLMPNPAHDRATVQLPPGPGPATLTVLDALGRPLRTQTFTGSKTELDLTGLAPGLYAVRVAAGGSTTQRLVVE